MTTLEKNNPVVRVIKAAGTQAELAAELDVSQQAVSAWLRRGWVPLKRAEKIEELYGIRPRAIVDPRLRALVGSR